MYIVHAETKAKKSGEILIVDCGKDKEYSFLLELALHRIYDVHADAYFAVAAGRSRLSLPHARLVIS